MGSSGHRAAHEPLLPQRDQPLEPLLFCLRLLDEQLRDTGEEQKEVKRINFVRYHLLRYVLTISVSRYIRGDITTLVKVETLITGKPRCSSFSALPKQQVCHIEQVLIFVSIVHYTQLALVYLLQVTFNSLILKICSKYS